MNNSHLIPQILIDLVADLKKANPSAQLAYLGRLEAIRDYVVRELENFQLKPYPKYDRKPQKKR